MNVQFLGASGESTASSYKVYRSLLKQSGTNVPTEVVLENTLGITLSWLYINVGHYALTSDIALDETKMVSFVGNNFRYSESSCIIDWVYLGGTTLTASVFVSAEGFGLYNTLINGNGTLLEIREYN